ncbi:hypothetical protein MCERE19_04367 [Spirosomataceae bacterium]|jgi:hypothetical protein
MFYNLYRSHGSLRKELKVKTPLNAVQKWYDIKPELFREKPEILYQKLINLQKQNNQILTTTLSNLTSTLLELLDLNPHRKLEKLVMVV